VVFLVTIGQFFGKHTEQVRQECLP